MKSAPAFLGKFIGNLKPAAEQAAIGTALTAGYSLLGGNPQAALAYGAGDFLLNVPAIALARSYFPGKTRMFKPLDPKTKKVMRDPKTNKPIVETVQDPSKVQNLANIGASVAAYPTTDAVLKSVGIDLYGQTRQAPQPTQYTFPTLGIDLPPEALGVLRAQQG